MQRTRVVRQRHPTNPLATAPVPLVGGRYELTTMIGRGGTGIVWAGRDRVLERSVAVKLLQPHLIDDADVRIRFAREARLAARLHHPHAVTVFDTGEHAGAPFIVMELVDGHTLSEVLADGCLPSERVRQIGVHILEALAAAHDLGIVHRDVKPGNVLLTTDGLAKLADFGIAKDTAVTDHTTVGFVVGTMAYLAPERLRGQPATPRSDLYAVGAVLYESITGVKPFTATSPASLLHDITTGRPPDPKTVGPGVDPVLAAIIMRALQRDPRRRFVNARAMLDVLSAHAVDVPSAAAAGATERFDVPPTGAAHAPARRSWRTGAAVLAIALLAGLAGLLAARVSQSPSPATEQRATVAPTSVAPDLQRAVDALARAVQPS